jgi:hypothetical protein
MFDFAAVSPHAPWIFLLVASLCVLLVGIAKAGFGGGVGVLATPLMSLVVSPLVAAGFLLPLLCACDLFSIWHYRRTFDRRSLVMLLPGAMAGIALGTLFLYLFREQTERTERVLKVAIGILAIAFVLYQVGRRWLTEHLAPRGPRPGAGHVLGLVSGFASMLAHAGGPPVTIFLINLGLDRRVFVGTTVWFFTLANYAKLVPYSWLGMINLTSLPLSACFLPVVPAGVWLGIRLNRRLDQRIFMRLIYAVLFLTGLQLVTGLNIFDWPSR